MGRKKQDRHECFGRKNIMTLTCYTLCQSGRCGAEEQLACTQATKERLRLFGRLPVSTEAEALSG
ncbi:MAG: hypothetical protein QHJ73_08600 [Armatimonadota bacterium]|nr:hypothetical protein [Armatimonadota bacterium]